MSNTFNRVSLSSISEAPTLHHPQNSNSSSTGNMGGNNVCTTDNTNPSWFSRFKKTIGSFFSWNSSASTAETSATFSETPTGTAEVNQEQRLKFSARVYHFFTGLVPSFAFPRSGITTDKKATDVTKHKEPSNEEGEKKKIDFKPSATLSPETAAAAVMEKVREIFLDSNTEKMVEGGEKHRDVLDRQDEAHYIFKNNASQIWPGKSEQEVASLIDKELAKIESEPKIQARINELNKLDVYEAIANDGKKVTKNTQTAFADW